MVDATSGGSLVNKTPAATKQLISNMVENPQQFGTRMYRATKRINDVTTSNLENQIFDLATLVRQLVVSQMHVQH